jgi:hypothetical protein
MYRCLKKAGIFKNGSVEAAVRLVSCGSSVIDMSAKSRLIIDDACRVFDRMHAQTM